MASEPEQIWYNTVYQNSSGRALRGEKQGSKNRSPKFKSKRQDHGLCPNPRGKSFPSTPSKKLPQPPHFLRGLPRRLAGQKVLPFDEPRGFGCSEIINSLNSFRCRFSQTFTVDNCHAFSSAASFTFGRRK